jgi:hypothetical protein
MRSDALHLRIRTDDDGGDWWFYQWLSSCPCTTTTTTTISDMLGTIQSQGRYCTNEFNTTNSGGINQVKLQAGSHSSSNTRGRPPVSPNEICKIGTKRWTATLVRHVPI